MEIYNSQYKNATNSGQHWCFLTQHKEGVCGMYVYGVCGMYVCMYECVYVGCMYVVCVVYV